MLPDQAWSTAERVRQRPARWLTNTHPLPIPPPPPPAPPSAQRAGCTAAAQSLPPREGVVERWGGLYAPPPERPGWLQVAKKVRCWNPRGAREEESVCGECKEAGTPGVGVAVGRRRGGVGEAAEEVLGPAWEEGNSRGAGSDLNQCSHRLFAAAGESRRRRTSGRSLHLQEPGDRDAASVGTGGPPTSPAAQAASASGAGETAAVPPGAADLPRPPGTGLPAPRSSSCRPAAAAGRGEPWA